MTPGHVTLYGDGVFKDTHVAVIDILRSAGALVRKDGTLVRACTNATLGTVLDQFVIAIAGRRLSDGSIQVRESGKIRLGTRHVLDDGQDASVADLIFPQGGVVTSDGLVAIEGSEKAIPFLWTFSETLPNPEDYILKRSNVSLAEIYDADNWEAIVPKLPYSMTQNVIER